MATMEEQIVLYSIGDKQFDALVVTPDTADPKPVVLVCHAWGGRNQFAEDKARELAELGYVGAAIDLYGVGVRGSDRETSNALMSALVEEPAELRRRLKGAYNAVVTHAKADGTRVGAIGFCFGGLCTILMARMGLAMNAAVSFHGLLKVGAPLDERVQAKLLILHGQDDPMVPSSDLAALSDELARVHAEWRLQVFPSTMHSFTNPDANDPDFGTVFNAHVSKRSWEMMKSFFDEHL